MSLWEEPRWIGKVVAAVLLIAILFFSASAIRGYFVNFQKDDWRGTAQFLSANCSGAQDLRLYFPQWTQKYAPYYAPAVAPQNTNLENTLITPNIEAFASTTPATYDKACLVVSHDFSPPVTKQIAQIQSALKAKYPVLVSTLKLSGVEVDMYGK